MRRFQDAQSRQNKNSIIVKEEIQHLNSSFPDFEANEQMPYDLEVQKPAERVKILRDEDFFKKLSLSFYSDVKVSSKSLSPKRYIEINSSGDTRIPVSNTNSDPLANRFNIGYKEFSENYTDRLSSPYSNSPKSFQIKSYANLHSPQLFQQNDYFGQDPRAKKTRELSNSRSPNPNPVRQLKHFLEQNQSSQKGAALKKPGWIFQDPISKPREKIPQKFNPYQTTIRLHSPKPNNQQNALKKIYLDNSFAKDIKKLGVSPQARADPMTSDYKLSTNFVVKAKLEQKLNQPSRLQAMKRVKYP